MNSEKIFLGVDGGGTKTAFILDVAGEIYESKQITIHPKQISKEEFYEIMQLGVSEVCDKALIKPEDIDFTFVASPGFGQYPDTESYIYNGIKKAIGSDRFKVDNDCVNGRAGSLNANPGINLVLGTGQIGYGVDESGDAIRVGGWGPLLGDEGSGYFIGLKLLNLYTKMSDGRLEKTILYEIIKDNLNINDDIEMIDLAEKMKRDEIASLSKILIQGLNKDEAYSKIILEDISKEAALVIDAIIDRLDFKEKVKVSYSGGVFNLGDLLLNKIKANIKNDIQIVAPYTSPEKGSLILAKKYYSERSES